ncbi:hypothetical protein A2797_00570 [candidate division WWE3 bacterium RIFCSPHIGHO2_01_FULL_48_15]|uniref:Uncharacterized protein n=1 Tax=candidate division WWE3 bacterium RIFCSPHIGHO2_01_FULL_48_15 TaxID=1802619 RepID=A0A1F4VCK1_UNCKA|nr:MAG: hypothetical protein A2797_00570 [candidate division WWE3 bacterium RIFCSPHIGHO2_01_FULL_48_15]
MDTERQNAVSALTAAYSKEPTVELPEGPKIKVSEAVATIALVYEKVRQVMEYNEPHLLRRAATERILSRRLRADSNTLLVAEGLIKELIRGRYLPNDYYPESLIPAVGGIIEKYRLILRARESLPTNDDFAWITRIASAEIEEFFAPPERDDALSSLMLANIQKAILLSDPALSESQAAIQLKIAIYENLLKLDQALLEFNLFELFYPDWKTAGKEHVSEVAANLPQIQQAITSTLNYQLSGSLSARVSRYTTPFVLLRDALLKEGAAIFREKLVFAQAVAHSYARRLAKEKERLATAATRALIYVFLTKAVLSFAFEIPAEQFIYGGIREIPFLINFIFPPLLIFLLTLSIKLPGRENEERVVSAAREAVYGDGKVFSEQNRVEIKKRGPGLAITLFTIYLAAFILIFGGVSYGLTKLGFTPFGIGLFFFYTSIVTYFGLKVRESSRELVMVGGKETLANLVFDFVALPFLKVGSIVSAGLARFNVLGLIATLLVEAPLQTVIEVLEEWVSFAREKKEELY